jgi:hypothetical protein
MADITAVLPIGVLTGKWEAAMRARIKYYPPRALRLSFKLASHSLMSIRGMAKDWVAPWLFMHALSALFVSLGVK